MCKWLCMCMYMYMSMHVNVCVWLCMYMYMYACAVVDVHACVYVYVMCVYPCASPHVHPIRREAPRLATSQPSPGEATDHVRDSFLPKAEPKDAGRRRIKDTPESEEGRVETPRGKERRTAQKSLQDNGGGRERHLEGRRSFFAQLI